MFSTQVEVRKGEFSWLDVIEAPIQAKGRRVVGVPFAVEECLEKNALLTAEKCLEVFKSKGGAFYSVNPFAENECEKRPFSLKIGDKVFPSCSGGWCRSQVLYTKLLKYFPEKIELLSPHATRYGCDPYNGEINWNKNTDGEISTDAFKDWAGAERALRIGFENVHAWKYIESDPSKENLQELKQYYDQHYFGYESAQNRRVYITFAANAHVILNRLNETNKSLDNAVVVHIDLDDSMTNPYDARISKLSIEAFQAFSLLLESVLDVSDLEK